MAAVCNVHVVLVVIVWALLAPSVNTATTTTTGAAARKTTQDITTAAQRTPCPNCQCPCPQTTTETPTTTTSPCPSGCQHQIDSCKQQTEHTAARFDNFTEKVEKDRAAQDQLLTDAIGNLTSRIDTAESRIKMVQSENEDLKKQVNVLETRANTFIDNMSPRIETLESLVMTFRTNLTSLISAGFITRCRVCFQETEGSRQCQGSRESCSGWSTMSSPSWTLPFRDDTDGRSGGCKYQWRVECQ